VRADRYIWGLSREEWKAWERKLGGRLGRNKRIRRVGRAVDKQPEKNRDLKRGKKEERRKGGTD